MLSPLRLARRSQLLQGMRACPTQGCNRLPALRIRAWLVRLLTTHCRSGVLGVRFLWDSCRDSNKAILYADRRFLRDAHRVSRVRLWQVEENHLPQSAVA